MVVEGDMCEVKLLEKENITLRSLDHSIAQTWLQHYPLQQNYDEFYDFPLFLPDDWDKKWRVVEETAFSFFCF